MVPLGAALSAFSRFMEETKAEFVWGNGATFDNVILRSAYSAIGARCPWHFRGDRDMRTLVSIAKSLGVKKEDMPEIDGGTKHDALDDARRQARIVQEICKRILG